MNRTRRFARKLLAGAAITATMGSGGAAFATNHAIIFWIGDYGSPQLNLPGIDKDAANATRIARTMGVPSQNIKEVANRQLTRQGMAGELSSLTARIAQGDKVFVYFSGHGFQSTGVGGARCTDSLVTACPSLVPDFEFQDALTKLGAKASQVVVMNDSCFSGGAATKALQSRSVDGGVAKFYPGEFKTNTAVTEGYRCGEAVNKMSRNLEVLDAQERGPNVLYVAAATDTEVAFATDNGSVATLAWAHCLANNTADTDRSGSVSGRELQTCSQNYINTRTKFKQTIMLQGAEALPISFAGASNSGSGGTSAGGGRVDPVGALRDLQAASSKDHQVRLSPASNELRIRQDFLDFNVSTNKPGYLYLLQVGSDGKTFNLLFPNKIDKDNYIAAGNHQFPRQNWRVRAGGPAGISHLLAIVTLTPKDLTKDMDLNAAFATAQANEQAAKTLIVETTGANGGSGAYGASAVVAINEKNP